MRSLLLCVIPTTLLAQAESHPTMRAALDAIRTNNTWTLEQQRTICEIPAPPFKEAVRGRELVRRFQALGLTNVRVDAEGNVVGERRGSADGPIVVLSAHLDTVFPEGTDVKVKREGTVMTAPGIGDDCRGLAVVLAAAKAIGEAKVPLAGTILFVGTVGEEGPGNLRGVRYLFTKSDLKSSIKYFISVDGTGLGLTSRAVGSNRYRVTFSGPGGHSFGAFGMPNPIHAMGRAIAKIGEIQVPESPKTTFNVGIVSGGTSVNTISPSGVMDVDLRSESAKELAAVDAKFRAAVTAALNEERARWPKSNVPLNVKIDTAGIRPTGDQPDDSPIVRTALATGKALGFTPEMSASSTDSNIPISLGIPAVTIDGGGRGRGAHATSESYDDTDKGWLGPQWAALLAVSLAGLR
jgi:tripeptide aminopeptidase